jgi:hypothetical protein
MEVRVFRGYFRVFSILSVYLRANRGSTLTGRNNCHARAVECKRPRSPRRSRRYKTPLRGTLALGDSRPRCWQAGHRGQVRMPGPSNGRPRRWKGAMAPLRRCSTIIVAYPRVATRYGRCCTTLIVVPRTGRLQPYGFSGGSFRISLRARYRRSMRCPCPDNAIRASQ